ncbi:MAG: right-handed parallel beta-helix repeat-containing protein [Patescibacteria group bacterium]
MAARAIRRRPSADFFLLFNFLIFGAAFSFSFFAGAVSAYTLAPERISGDVAWRADESPFVISSDLTVEDGAKLSIESGATVAVSGDRFISVYGEIAFGNGGSQKTVIDSTMNLLNQFQEFGLVAFDGELHVDVYGGRASFTGIDSGIPLHIQSDGGNILSRDSFLPRSEITLTNRASGEINNSILESSDNIMLLGTSSLSVSDSNITGGSASGSLFNIFRGSSVRFENSVISPMFSDFALLLDGSSLSATSTRVSDMNSYGIQASRGSRVSLFDTTMDTILSPSASSAFVMLVGSKADIAESRFLNTESNAIELYQHNGIYSELSLADSTIEDYGQAGISAVQANLSVRNSIIRRGAIGIENIFATSTISNSNISGNSLYGITAYTSAYAVSARNNFWGDASGPRQAVLNPDGLGNAVSDNVLFSPWLLANPKTSCCSSVLFLPGMEASRLYVSEDRKGGGRETRLWEPSSFASARTSELFMNDAGESIRSDIYTRDVIDEALVSVAGPNIYKSFIVMMDGLKKDGTITDWESIAYDWRLPLARILSSGGQAGKNISYLKATSSPYIIQELENLAKNSKTGRVTLIAHSNGGLLAKSLMMRLSEMKLENLVDRIIFVAVPQTGTPQAVGALLHGFGQSIPFILSAKTAMEFGLNMPGAYNLLPSASYFDFVSDPVIKLRESGTNIASSTLLRDFLAEKKLNPLLLKDSKAAHESLDRWLSPANIELIQIAGWGLDTVSGIEYYRGIKRGKPVTRYKPVMVVDGDNTVVVPSALAMATSTPNIRRYWLDLGAHNKASFLGRKHGNILEVESLRNFLKNIIKKENQTLPLYISTTTPISTAPDKRLRFTLHSPSLRLNLYDGEGNHTGISTTTGYVEEKIPSAYYQEFGQVKYISVPVSLSAGRYDSKPSLRLTITMSKSGESRIFSSETIDAPDSFTLEIDEVVGNKISTTTSFTDIPSEEKMLAVLDIYESISGLPPLKVDGNGDGVVDFEVKPGEIFVAAEAVSENQEIIISNKASNFMEIIYKKTEPEIFASENRHGQSRRLTAKPPDTAVARKTSMRDIQELIDSVKLPASVRMTTDEMVKAADASLQTAAVFGSGQTTRDSVRSVASIIIAILKAIWAWILRLFVL